MKCDICGQPVKKFNGFFGNMVKDGKVVEERAFHHHFLSGKKA